MFGESLEQAPVPFWRDRTDRTGNPAAWQDGKEPQPDERLGEEPAALEVEVGRRDDLVEVFDSLLELCADPADQDIATSRHFAEDDHWATFGLLIDLRQGR